MNKNHVIILVIFIFCFGVAVLAGVMGAGSREEMTSGETTVQSEKAETTKVQPPMDVLETETAAETKQGSQKATVGIDVNTSQTQVPEQSQTQKDDYGKGDDDSSSQSDSETEHESEPKPQPDPDESGDGEDLEWTPDIM